VIRVFASEAPELYYLAELIARYTNAHCHYDLAQMSEDKRIVAISEFKDWFEELTH
jgi:hypothetical protein